jgi:TorA maturation chaperone TorD
MSKALRGKYDSMSIDLVETARHRSNVYGFLSLIYRREISEYLLIQLKEPSFFYILYSIGADLEDDFIKSPNFELLNALAEDYTKLFVGPVRHIPPYESVHHKRDDGDWGAFWGKSTVEVKKFMESAGLRYKFEYSGIPDHISVELDFMREVTKEEVQAWAAKEIERIYYCLSTENEFINKHLSKWVPEFCDKVIAQAGLSFYREIAKATKQFIGLEKKEIGNFLSMAERVRSSTTA